MVSIGEWISENSYAYYSLLINGIFRTCWIWGNDRPLLLTLAPLFSVELLQELPESPTWFKKHTLLGNLKIYKTTSVGKYAFQDCRKLWIWKFLNLKLCNSGTLETLELLNFETLNFGILYFGNFETLELCFLERWNFDTLRFWNFETLKLWDFETLKLWDFETLKLCNLNSVKLWYWEIHIIAY